MNTNFAGLHLGDPSSLIFGGNPIATPPKPAPAAAASGGGDALIDLSGVSGVVAAEPRPAAAEGEWESFAAPQPPAPVPSSAPTSPNARADVGGFTDEDAFLDMDGEDAAWVRSYAAATRCFVSPLTRAVQTAAFVVERHPGALGASRTPLDTPASTPSTPGADRDFAATASETEGHGTCPPARRKFERLSSAHSARGGPGDGSVVLLRSAREIKSTVGSNDVVGIEQGGGILDRCATKLRDVLGPAEEGRVADDAMDAFAARCDVNDAIGQWWTAQSDTDGAVALASRFDDFFDALRFDPHESVLLVGHSLFLREIMRRFASPSLEGDANDVVTKLREYKLQNCGCVGVDVAFDENLGTPTVVDARMMFGSACVGKASKYEAIGAGAE
jgi:broad specificity phosphatase PhoE